MHEVPATQVGGDETEPSNPNGAPRQSTPRRRRRTKNSSAVQVHLPPAAVREATELQNFFPLSRQAEKEDVLEPEKEPKAEDRNKDLLEVETEGA